MDYVGVLEDRLRCLLEDGARRPPSYYIITCLSNTPINRYPFCINIHKTV